MVSTILEEIAMLSHELPLLKLTEEHKKLLLFTRSENRKHSGASGKPTLNEILEFGDNIPEGSRHDSSYMFAINALSGNFNNLSIEEKKKIVLGYVKGCTKPEFWAERNEEVSKAFDDALNSNIVKELGKQEEENHLFKVEIVKYLSGDVIRNIFLPLTEKLGLVGEETLKVTSYLCGNSRLTNEINASLHCRVIGDSGMGKSKVMEFIGENFIGKDFIERASFTVASIYRRGKDYFKQKVLFLSEIMPPGESQEEINALFRTLKTKGKAERDVTTKKGNDIVSITLTAEGPTSFCGTTVNSEGRDEDLNRDIVLNPDNSRQQTHRIQKSKMRQKKKYSPGIKKALRFNLQVQNEVQEFLKEFIPVFIEIPYSEFIELPVKGGAARRDPDKITRLIESCCQTNILNRALKLLNCAEKINELIALVNDFRSNPLHQMLNDELESNSNKSKGINDLMKSTSEMLEARYSLYMNLQEIDLNSDVILKTEKVIIKKQDDDILLFTSDPKINYIVLKEFVKKNSIQFVLISDTRDFEIVKEYCAEAIESPYQKLTRAYQAAYRKILEVLPDLPRNKGGGEVGLHCTVADVEDILECSNHWAWDTLKKLVNEGYCSVDEKKKPHIYNFTKSKLAESHNKEGTEHFYKLVLKPFPKFQKLTSSNVYNSELNPNSKEKQEMTSDEVPISKVIQSCNEENTNYNKWTEDNHTEEKRPALPKVSEEDSERARKAIRDSYKEVFGKDFNE